MRQLGLMFVLAVVSACAHASGDQSDASRDDGSRQADAKIDGNNCAVQPCSILPQCGCNGQNACDVDTTDSQGTACRPITMPGKETAACASINDCDRGYVCLGGSAYASCKKYCTGNTDCGSPRGQCVIDLTNNNVAIQDVPSACSSNCDPTSTNPPECPSTYKCGLFTATHMGNPVKIADCSPAATSGGAQGATCQAGANQGNDALCTKGYLCTTVTAGTYSCRRMCLKSASNCGALTCISFNPAFLISGVEYGVCN